MNTTQGVTKEDQGNGNDDRKLEKNSAGGNAKVLRLVNKANRIRGHTKKVEEETVTYAGETRREGKTH